MKWMLISLTGLALVFAGCDYGDTPAQDCDGALCDDQAGSFVGGGQPDYQVPGGELDNNNNTPENGTDPLDGEELVENTETDPGTETNPGETEIVEEEEIDEEELGDAPIALDDLEVDEINKIDVLRTTIFAGLDVGGSHYLETVSIALQELDLVTDYESNVADGWEILGSEVESCPFVKYYDEQLPPTNELECEYLVNELAKYEAYSKLTSKLDSSPPPMEALSSSLVEAEEVEFWYEMGAISGIEERRVLVGLDLKIKGLCDQVQTAVSSSYDKGLIVGRELMVKSMNSWLATQGHKADYPVMSEPVEVCNSNATVLEPAHEQAITSILAAMQDEPLCDFDYSPPSPEAANQWEMAKSDYQVGMKQGIEDEFSLAAVKVFKVVPCNVSDPIVMDLDGDGIELLPIYKGVNFDLWASGREQAMAWPTADDGFLVLDRNGNGIIDNGTELFGNIDQDYADGFAHLSELDKRENGGNGDGMLTSADAAFSQLFVWKDANLDAKTDRGELITLKSIQVTMLPIVGTPSELESGGNPISFIAQAKTETGTMLMGDAFLHTAPYPRLAMVRR